MIKEDQLRKCTLCESDRADLLYKQPHWDVYRCSNCGLVFVQTKFPPPSEVEEINFSDEDLGGKYMKRVFIDQHDFWLSYWTSHIVRITPLLTTDNPRLLDIGCAMGHFMLAAREAGWQPLGVELSKRQADYARNVFNLDVLGIPIEEADFSPHSFDIIEQCA